MFTHNWRASLRKFFRLKVLLIQFLPVALSVMFLLAYAKCNFASELKHSVALALVVCGKIFVSKATGSV